MTCIREVSVSNLSRKPTILRYLPWSFAIRPKTQVKPYVRERQIFS